MLRRFSQLGVRCLLKNMRSTVQTSVSLRNQQIRRCFSNQAEDSDSHSDFQPKYKNLVNQNEDFFRKIEIPVEITDEAQIVENIRSVISNSPVVVFMKGDFDRPQCGYSNFVVQVLKFYNVKKGHFLNVLERNEIRIHGNKQT